MQVHKSNSLKPATTATATAYLMKPAANTCSHPPEPAWCWHCRLSGCVNTERHSAAALTGCWPLIALIQRRVTVACYLHGPQFGPRLNRPDGSPGSRNAAAMHCHWHSRQGMLQPAANQPASLPAAAAAAQAQLSCTTVVPLPLKDCSWATVTKLYISSCTDTAQA